jgi:hypothetical protein
MIGRPSMLRLIIAATTIVAASLLGGCDKKFRDEWCGNSGWINSCPDERAFDWLKQYDKCIDRTVDDGTLQFVHVTTVPAYCALFFLPKGISTEQISRYRMLNPKPN